MPATRTSTRRASRNTENVIDSTVEQVLETADAPQHESQEEDDEEDIEERLEKEKDVWESIAEQHFEVIDQLPLTLHRQFSLLGELGEQADGYAGALQRTIREYITKRTAIKDSAAPVSEQLPEIFSAIQADGMSTPMESEPPLKTPDSPHPSHHKPFPNITPIPLRLTTTINGERTPLNRTLSDFAPQTPTTPIAIPLERQKPPETTREMLSHMGWLMDEWMKTCNEKVSLAQSAHDSVGRQIRLVEQAIKEQEAALAIGTREGTQALPVVVSEVVAPPRWQREPARTTLSPVLDDIEMQPEDLLPAEAEDPPRPVIPQTKKGRRGRKSQSHAAAQRGRKPTFKLKLMGPKVYCYCHGPDDGSPMIECSGFEVGIHCLSNEWVHLRCMTPAEAANVANVKEGESWYCRSCQRAVEQA